jgi:pyrroline-5-carboxylate reductase
MELQNTKIAIIGGGNIGSAITRGLLRSGNVPAENIILTRRNISKIAEFSSLGVQVRQSCLPNSWGLLIL